MTLGDTDWWHQGYGSSGTLAPDSSLNPDVSFNISTLTLGHYTGGPVGTVNLTKFTGTFAVAKLGIGGGFDNSSPGTGHFIFGNNTMKQLTIPDLRIANGDITVNADACLNISSNLLLGFNGGTGAIKSRRRGPARGHDKSAGSRDARRHRLVASRLRQFRHPRSRFQSEPGRQFQYLDSYARPVHRWARRHDGFDEVYRTREHQ